MTPLFPTQMDVTKTKGFDDEFGPPLTTAENHQRDEQIMDHMYPLNMHARTVLGIEPTFIDPVDDDVPIDEDNLQTNSDVDTVFDTKDVDPLQAVEEAKGEDAIDD
ncbi:hypothetical protein H5410_004342 [Solanum commersonii]|uniref:Uncharacterized protein n=1 Tax=Solanum commersonii TaxID=4109 RepID=A0A9J6B7I0_SOLCO|nr:hypothetical protein H5410_004342 [Solanum commersonii]